MFFQCLKPIQAQTQTSLDVSEAVVLCLFMSGNINILTFAETRSKSLVSRVYRPRFRTLTKESQLVAVPLFL